MFQTKVVEKVITDILCSVTLLTCICLRRTSARWNSGERRRMTSSHPQLVRVLCDVTAEHSRSVNLGTRYVYTCGSGMRKGGGMGWGQNKTYLLRRWLMSSVRTAVSCVCYYSISMADTDIDAIRKQKRAERNKQYRLKCKMEMQQQASTSSETKLGESKRRKSEYNKQ